MFRINYNKAYFSCKCFLLKREFLPDDLTFQIDLSAVPEGYIDMDGYVLNNVIIQY